MGILVMINDCLGNFDNIVGSLGLIVSIIGVIVGFIGGKEIKEAKKVIKKLKECGWNFASHSYGHYHMNKLTDNQFEEELKLWK